MSRDLSETNYNQVFPDDKSKAEAFDKIAKMFYYGNFTTAPKSEIELVMFSLYMNNLYDLYSSNPYMYSDCELSDVLGITPSRIAAYKEKMVIKYGDMFDYDWKEAFVIEAKKAESGSDGKIHINISDMRLYVQLRKEIERLESYSEASLTKQMLIVSPLTFLNLMIKATPDKDKEKLKKDLADVLDKNGISAKDFLEEKTTFGKCMRNASVEAAEATLLECVKLIPFFGNGLSKGTEVFINAIKKQIKEQKRNEEN